MIVFELKDAKEKIDLRYRYVLYLLFCMLIFASCILFSMPAAAQYPEEIKTAEVQQGFDPDAQSYLAFAMSAYWRRTAKQSASMGNQSFSQESYQESRKQLMAAIQLDPRSSFLYTKLAENSFLLGDFTGTKTAAETAIKFNPSNADAHYWAGIIKYKFIKNAQDASSIQDAIDEFRKAAELDPGHLEAQYYLASLSFGRGNYSQAARAYSEMIKLRPYDPELRYRLGVSYTETGEILKAIDAFRASTMIREDYLEAHFRLANLYANLSKNKESIVECLIVLSRVPRDPNVNLLLAQLYVSTAEYDKAITLCNEILSPGFPLGQESGRKAIIAETYYRLALAYKEKGDAALADLNFQKSIDVYKSMLGEENASVGINYDIAMVYDAKGDVELAEKYLLRHIQLKPDEPNAYNYLGYMYVEHSKNLEIAANFIKKAVDMNPKNGAFRDSLGWAYFKLGNLDEAIAELEKAVKYIPDDSDVREHLGEAYIKKGGEFTQKAVLEWKKAIELKPQKSALRQKLDELYKSLNLTKTE